MKLSRWRPLVYTLAVGVLVLAVVAILEGTIVSMACLLIVAVFGLGLIALLLGVKFRFGCRVLGVFRWMGNIDN
jgi:hypothetical protein